MLFGDSARFERCDFRDVRIGEIYAKSVEFVDCMFSGIIRRWIVWGSPPPEYGLDGDRDEASARPAASSPAPPIRLNQFEGNDFSRVSLGDVNFSAGSTSPSRCSPKAETLSFCPGGLLFSTAQETPWLSGQNRTIASVRRRFMASMHEIVDEGQAQLFLREGWYGSRPGTHRFFELLRELAAES